MGGSSRREREVWRERAPSFKRGLSPSKVYPYHFIVFNVLFGSALARSSADL